MPELHVFLSPSEVTPAEIAGKVVAVIDVLRASTSIAVALANGAKSVVPLSSVDEAMIQAKQMERGDVRLAGERKLERVEGFDIGNSPLDFTEEQVSGKTVLMTTSNGTGAILAAQGAREVVVASYVNYSAVLAMLRAAAGAGTGVAIICAGRDKQFALEDAGCAGRYVRNIIKRLQTNIAVSDAAYACSLIDRKYGDNLTTLFEESNHGKALIQGGFERDIQTCAQLDAFPVVPIFQERQITLLGPNRER